MKKLALSIVMIFAMIAMVNAQKYYTKTGKTDFKSEAPLETIEAINNAATCVLDSKTGNMEIAILIKAFKFEKALMQEHFNENYMESSKFPKANFKGKITNIEAVNLKKDGIYKVNVIGDLTIHGETKAAKTTGTITVKGGEITAKSSFKVILEDYKIAIPNMVKDKIAKEVAINVDFNLEELRK